MMTTADARRAVELLVAACRSGPPDPDRDQELRSHVLETATALAESDGAQEITVDHIEQAVAELGGTSELRRAFYEASSSTSTLGRQSRLTWAGALVYTGAVGAVALGSFGYPPALLALAGAGLFYFKQYRLVAVAGMLQVVLGSIFLVQDMLGGSFNGETIFALLTAMMGLLQFVGGQWPDRRAEPPSAVAAP